MQEQWPGDCNYRDICGVDCDLGELAGEAVLERFLQSDGLVVVTDPTDDPLEVTQTSTVQAHPASHPVLNVGHGDGREPLYLSENADSSDQANLTSRSIFHLL